MSTADSADFWRSFDLPTWSEVLIKTSEVVQINQNRSLTSRKSLAVATKTFRSRPVEERLQDLGKFVKKYQIEVDDLTARALYAENSFSKLAAALNNAPDPAPILKKASIQLPKVKELKRKNKKLQEEVQELEKEFDGLSNQDITIRELQLQIQSLESGNDNKIEGIAAQHIEDLEYEFEEKNKILEEEKISINKKVILLRASEIEAQTRADVVESRLFAVQSRAEENVAALEYDLELEQLETKRIREKCADLELQLNDKNSTMITSPKSNQNNSNNHSNNHSTNNSNNIDSRSGSSGGTTSISEDDIHALRDEIVLKNAQLMRAEAEIEKYQILMNSTGVVSSNAMIEKKQRKETQETDTTTVVSRNEWQNTCQSEKVHREQLKQTEAIILKVAQRLLGRKNVKNVKNVKSENDNDADEDKEEDKDVNDKDVNDNEDKNGNGNALLSSAVNVFELQHVLNEICQKYESTTTNLRNKLDISQNDTRTLEKNIDLQHQEIQQLNQLITTLEKEATSTTTATTTTATTAAMSKNRNMHQHTEQSELEQKSKQPYDKTASLLETVLVKSIKSKTSTGSNGSNGARSNPLPLSPSSSSSPSTISMVQVLTAQRDRYREKVQVLEQKVASFNTISATNSNTTTSSKRNIGDYDRLYKENLKLNVQISKLNKKMNVLRNNVNRQGNGTGSEYDLEEGNRGLQKSRGTKGRNTTASSSSLNGCDKILLSLGRLLMMNRYSRLIIFGYIGLLHCVLFLTLHNFSHSSYVAHHHSMSSKNRLKAKFRGEHVEVEAIENIINKGADSSTQLTNGGV